MRRRCLARRASPVQEVLRIPFRSFPISASEMQLRQHAFDKAWALLLESKLCGAASDDLRRALAKAIMERAAQPGDDVATVACEALKRLLGGSDACN